MTFRARFARARLALALVAAPLGAIAGTATAATLVVCSEASPDFLNPRNLSKANQDF